MPELSLVLASNSPRRRQLLALGGWSFRVQPADIDETPLPGEAPADYVLRLARSKAAAAAALCQPHELVIAADTTVADGAELLGKPQDAADARRMLRQLRGRTHQVYTGVALQRVADHWQAASVVASAVLMRAYTAAEIEAYIAGGDPFDKAGAYAIQHAEFHPVEHFDACYANVVGLPLCHLAQLLRQAGVLPQSEPLSLAALALVAPAPAALAPIPLACQSALNYPCTAFPAILGPEA